MSITATLSKKNFRSPPRLNAPPVPNFGGDSSCSPAANNKPDGLSWSERAVSLELAETALSACDQVVPQAAGRGTDIDDSFQG